MEQALLTRQIDVHECARRIASTNKPADLVLAAGSIRIVVDTFDGGGAFLVGSAVAVLIGVTGLVCYTLQRLRWRGWRRLLEAICSSSLVIRPHPHLAAQVSPRRRSWTVQSR
jgi:hypothetical protein